MIIGILLIIKGVFDMFKGINYYIFKDNFKTIPMELTAIYKSPASVHGITYIYCYQSIHQETNIKYKTKGYHKKEAGDIDFFNYDEKFHIIYESEENIISKTVFGIFLFLFGLRIVLLYV